MALPKKSGKILTLPKKNVFVVNAVRFYRSEITYSHKYQTSGTENADIPEYRSII
jgi:hypothetical protein